MKEFRVQPQEEYTTKTFRIPTDLLNELEKIAIKNNLSANKVLIQCTKYALENMAEDEEEPDEDTKT